MYNKSLMRTEKKFSISNIIFGYERTFLIPEGSIEQVKNQVCTHDNDNITCSGSG